MPQSQTWSVSASGLCTQKTEQTPLPWRETLLLLVTACRQAQRCSSSWLAKSGFHTDSGHAERLCQSLEGAVVNP
jgi:hypothetical protein